MGVDYDLNKLTVAVVAAITIGFQNNKAYFL